MCAFNYEKNEKDLVLALTVPESNKASKVEEVVYIASKDARIVGLQLKDEKELLGNREIILIHSF